MSSGVDGERALLADGGTVWKGPGGVVRDLLGRAGGSGCSWGRSGDSLWWRDKG